MKRETLSTLDLHLYSTNTAITIVYSMGERFIAWQGNIKAWMLNLSH